MCNRARQETACALGLASHVTYVQLAGVLVRVADLLLVAVPPANLSIRLTRPRFQTPMIV